MMTLVRETIGRVMVIVAHPDDADSWAGGTVAKFSRSGAKVAYVVVTSGEKGSGDRTMRSGVAFAECFDRVTVPAEAARITAVLTDSGPRC
jgi:LmbE family N-acetylglucosaminyl deacetylase